MFITYPAYNITFYPARYKLHWFQFPLLITKVTWYHPSIHIFAVCGDGTIAGDPSKLRFKFIVFIWCANFTRWWWSGEQTTAGARAPPAVTGRSCFITIHWGKTNISGDLQQVKEVRQHYSVIWEWAFIQISYLDKSTNTQDNTARKKIFILDNFIVDGRYGMVDIPVYLLRGRE